MGVTVTQVRRAVEEVRDELTKSGNIDEVNVVVGLAFVLQSPTALTLIANSINQPLGADLIVARPFEQTSDFDYKAEGFRLFPAPEGNGKRAGWNAFFELRGRNECPFPPARRDLLTAYQTGWDEAEEVDPR